MTPQVVAHSARLIASYRRWTGGELIAPAASEIDQAALLYDAPSVILSHGTEPDPLLNYGNQRALRLWETAWDQFTRTPSRLTADPEARDERARVLAEVTRRGFLDDYRGIRISASGRRFLIEKAVVWVVADAAGRSWGLAARFDQWTYLEEA